MGGICASKPAVKDPPRPNGTQQKDKQDPATKSDKAKNSTSSSSSSVLGKDTPNVNSLYTLGRVLGRGQFGTTRLATEKSTGKDLACKTIGKRKLITPEDVEDVRREVQIMYHLRGHDNIVRMVNAFEDKQSVHLVMELCSGGELFDRIVARGHYTEKDAAEQIRTIVSVVAHCHTLGVVHRDLKPENFLLSNTSSAAPLKATDFGLSVFYKPGQILTDIVGSAYYVAPEVLRRRYGKEADLWSCGVMLYILLCGVPPFYGESEQQIFAAVLKGNLDFESEPWPSISGEAKDCVKAMLQQEPSKRATAQSILQHSWMRENGTARDTPLDNAVVVRMRQFAGMNKLKKEALKVVATGMSPEEIAGLRSIFQALDSDRSGTVTLDELREGLRQQGSPVAEKELAAMLASVDVDSTGTIDYDEFIAATVHQSLLEQEDTMFRAFQHFDADGSGFITKDELQAALKDLGGNSEKHLKEILAEVDRDNDGRIDYDEFCTMMRGNEQKLIGEGPAARRGAIF